MTGLHEMDTEQLLGRVAAGDDAARGPLLQRHRQRLRHMIAVRLDPQVRARVDPSDVVQESLAEADRKLSDYARRRPVPFYPWLRSLAWERLVHLHRRHIRAQRRSVRREQAAPPLPDNSLAELAQRLAGAGSAPSARMRRAELRDLLQAALARLSADDREVLVLRYLEDLATKEIAAVLRVKESAVRMRQLRALQRLRDLLGDDVAEELS
ncbi:MAG TPA: sigma-70 family RNA polymerase sigma factor [Gemmataceae bacterium]|jgi:RNA polymerase sigma-70 factor (ECF subfamily)|nr:sigma-70 family RNA polymerase sigma factor [Gemmataceae bacterium]